jgi:hypothetical protein
MVRPYPYLRWIVLTVLTANDSGTPVQTVPLLMMAHVLMVHLLSLFITQMTVALLPSEAPAEGHGEKIKSFPFPQLKAFNNGLIQLCDFLYFKLT